MGEAIPNAQKQASRHRFAFLAWLVLVPLSFIVVFGVMWMDGERGWGMVAMSLGIATVLAVVVTVGVLFARWLCVWRNLRRFLFGVACLVTLVALFYAEENWRGKHAWQTHRAYWEAKGEKFDLPSLAPPPVPDDKNLALAPLFKPVLEFTNGPTGTVWLDTNGLERLKNFSANLMPDRKTNDELILGSLDKGTFADLAKWVAFYQGNTNYPQAPATAKPAEVVLTALGRSDPELKELREDAASRPYARFPVRYTYEPSWAILLPHLANIKHVAVFLNARAVAELEAGRPDDAFAELMLAFRLSDSISKEPLLIDHLVRIALLAIDLQTVREGLVRHVWTDAQLTEMQNYLGSLNILAEFKLSMSGELACSTGGLDYLRRQGFVVNPMTYLGTEDGLARTAPIFIGMPRGWYYQNMLTLSEFFHEYFFPTADEKARRVFPEVSKRAFDTIDKLPVRPYTIFAKLLLPALDRAIAKSARMQTFVDEAGIACALERYRMANGKLPETLTALAPKFMDRVPDDVIGGGPLRYRVEAGGGYVLYSVGWNETDDGGKIVLAKNTKTASVDVTQGDWVWQMPGG